MQTPPSFDGFAELRHPADLYAKLHHDVGRMIEDPGGEYAAFDFFVTAEHIVDWLHPTSKQKQKALRNSDPLLELVSHLANGAKHFQATARHHTSVNSLKREEYVDSSCKVPGVSEDELIVHLTESQARIFGCVQFETITLAHRVIDYWRPHFE